MTPDSRLKPLVETACGLDGEATKAAVPEGQSHNSRTLSNISPPEDVIERLDTEIERKRDREGDMLFLAAPDPLLTEARQTIASLKAEVESRHLANLRMEVKLGNALARAASAERERDQLREATPSIWRCGVMAAIEAIDVLLPEMRRSRRLGVREEAQRLDALLQRVANLRQNFAPTSYEDAAKARDEITASARQALKEVE